jgi:diguanylate cyclase (GGDEF)-like protein/PAS domain S-box-containing protein
MAHNDTSHQDDPENSIELHPGFADDADSTETLDLSNLFTRDLTLSGSFNLTEVKGTTFGRLLNAIPVPSGLIDRAYCITFCNEAWRKIGGNPIGIEGQSFLSLFPGTREAASVRSTVDEVYRNRKSLVQEGRVLLEDRIVWARLYFRPLRLGDDRVILMIVEDLTSEKEKTELLKTIERAKKEWERTVDSVSELIAIVDDQFRILRANKAMSTRAGIPIREAIGAHCFKLVHATDKPPPCCPLVRSLAEGREVSEEYYDEKSSRYFKETVSPIHADSGDIDGWAITAIDVTEQKKWEEELRLQAICDELTNLFNRRYLREMLGGACETARRYDHALSLCMLDVDNLKQVNDMHGHEGGDQVLKWVGSVVGKKLRCSDFAGRYGGDEFIVVLPHTSVEGAAECISRIQCSMRDSPFQMGPESFSVTFSAGISGFIASQMTPDDLIRSADRALYVAKRQGGNRIVMKKRDEFLEVQREGCKLSRVGGARDSQDCR